MKDLGKFIQVDSDTQQKIDTIKRDLLSNKTLLAYMKKNQISLTEAKLTSSLMNLIHFTENHEKCKTCTGLDTCKQMNQGYKPILKGFTIIYSYTICPL